MNLFLIALISAICFAKFAYPNIAVNMTQKEFISMVQCLAEDPDLCFSFIGCEVDIPENVRISFIECSERANLTAVQQHIRCYLGQPMRSTETFEKILDCINEEIPELDDEEKEGMVKYQDCLKSLDCEEE